MGTIWATKPKVNPGETYCPQCQRILKNDQFTIEMHPDHETFPCNAYDNINLKQIWCNYCFYRAGYMYIPYPPKHNSSSILQSIWTFVKFQ